LFEKGREQRAKGREEGGNAKEHGMLEWWNIGL